MVLQLPERWDAGLREDQLGSEPPSAATQADNVEFNTTIGPTKRTGFSRVSKTLPDASALRLDGYHTCGVIDLTETGGSNLKLTAGSDFTMVFNAVLRVPETGSDEPGTYLWEWSEGPFVDTNLFLYIASRSDGTYRLRAVTGDGTGSVNPLSTVPLQLNTMYTLAVRWDDSEEKLGVRVFGSEDWQESAALSGGGGSGSPAQPSSAEVDIHAHVGAKGRQVANLNDGNAISRMQRVGAIDIHRIRVWQGSLVEPDTATAPTVDYRFTERTGLTLADAQSAAPNIRIVETGQNEFGAGVDKIPHRSFAEWETSSPLIGDGSLKFDGYTHFLKIENAYRYRKAIKNFEDLEEDTDLEEWDEHSHFGVAVICKFDDISRDMGICHFAPVRTTDTDTRPGGGSGDYYFALWLDADGDSGNPAVAFSWGYSGGENTLYHDHDTVALDTTNRFLIFATRDVTTGETNIRVTKTTTSWDDEQQNASAETTFKDPVDGSKFDDRKSKYAFVLGGLMRSTRFATNENNADDPNDFKLRLNYRRMFKGTMDSFCFFGLERETGGSGAIPKEYVLQLLTRNWTQENITAASTQFRILSAFFFEEGSGDITIDRGLLGNHQRFVTDPDRSYVRSQMDYTVEEATPPGIDAIGELDDPIFGRKVVALAGPALYEIDKDNKTITSVGEGVRNDANSQAFMKQYGSDLLICTDGSHKPYRYTGDALFPLGIEPLSTDQIRYGLVQQGYEKAVLEEGVYRYRIVYYSAITGKEGDWDSEVQVKVVRKGNANVAFGATSTSDSTANSLTMQIRPNQRAASLDSPTEGPYDITNSVANWTEAILVVQVAGGGPGGASARYEQEYTLKVTASDVDDPENVTATELAKIIDRKAELLRCFAVKGRKKLRFLSAYVGKVSNVVDSQLTLTNTASPGTGQSDLYDILGFTSSSTFAVGEDAGNSAQPLPTPSRSPQVTHIRFYRTSRDGSAFLRAGEIPIGTTPEGYTQGRFWIDDVSDDDLVFRSPMDERKGEPPKCSMVEVLEGYTFFAGDKNNPQRLYFSVPGQPNQVEPGSFVDVLDGGSLEITALKVYAGTLLIFKEHATLVLTIVSSPVFPFDIETRKPDVGCYSRFGVVQVDNALHTADPNYPRMYDSMSFNDAGYKVYRSWRDDITDTEGRALVGIHCRRDRQIWFANPSDYVFVYNYGKGAWCKYRDMRVRCAATVLESGRLSQVLFGDDLGGIYQLDEAVLNDGGSLITDAGEVNESLTGTGFVVSGTTITLTGFTITEAQSGHIRGVWLYLSDGSAEASVRVVRVDDSGNVIVEAATGISDATYASGAWSLARTNATYLSGPIENGTGQNLKVQRYVIDMQTVGSQTDTHDIDLLAAVDAGVVTPGTLTKTVRLSAGDSVLGFPFQARKFRWGIRNTNPDEPFSVANIRIDGYTPGTRGRAF